MKSERPPTGSVQPLVAAAPGHAAESSAGPAARPLPPRTDAGSAASERESGDWEHLAPAVVDALALVRRYREVVAGYNVAIDKGSNELFRVFFFEKRRLELEMKAYPRSETQQPRGGNA